MFTLTWLQSWQNLFNSHFWNNFIHKNQQGKISRYVAWKIGIKSIFTDMYWYLCMYVCTDQSFLHGTILWWCHTCLQYDLVFAENIMQYFDWTVFCTRRFSFKIIGRFYQHNMAFDLYIMGVGAFNVKYIV